MAQISASASCSVPSALSTPPGSTRSTGCVTTSTWSRASAGYHWFENRIRLHPIGSSGDELATQPGVANLAAQLKPPQRAQSPKRGPGAAALPDERRVETVGEPEDGVALQAAFG